MPVQLNDPVSDPEYGGERCPCEACRGARERLQRSQRAEAFSWSQQATEEPCEDCGCWDCACDECGDCGDQPCTCNESTDTPTLFQRPDVRSDDDLFSYGYRPRPIFNGTGPVFLGMELEIETRDMYRSLRVANRAMGPLGYMKEDSSINQGFEIVTHPMDYEYAMAAFPWEMLSDLRDSGAYVMQRNNGLHVHVSRKGFADPCHMYRWMKFFYRNQDQVIRLARRNSTWGAFHPDARKAVAKLVKDPWRDHAKQLDRYQAINTQPKDTFEVRVFASSLDPEEVQGSLALTASTVEFTRDQKANDIIARGGWRWDTYRNWLTDQGDKYAPVINQVEKLCAS